MYFNNLDLVIAPDQLIQLLSYMYSNHTNKTEFLSTLSTGGWDNKLSNRMEEIENERGIRAKTGSLLGVRCLSGYAFLKNGESLAFSIMINGYVGDSFPYQKLQDDICRILLDK